MIIPDLNLLIYAYDQRAPQHPQAHLWWAQLLRGDEPVGITLGGPDRFRQTHDTPGHINPTAHQRTGDPK